MSYDITLVDKDTDEILIDLNYTYNASPMFRLAFEPLGDGINCLHGMSASAAMFALDHAIEKMIDDPETFREMNPPNGWGSYAGALELLVRLRRACYLVGTDVMGARDCVVEVN